MAKWLLANLYMLHLHHEKKIKDSCYKIDFQFDCWIVLKSF
jgi:hypothetical protein